MAAGKDRQPHKQKPRRIRAGSVQQVQQMNPNDTPAKGHTKRRHTPEVTAYVVIAILSMLKTGARMGSQEIQDRLSREYGVSITLRTVQRHLARLTELFPVDADEKSPRGYRWAKTEQAMVMRETVMMMQEAA